MDIHRVNMKKYIYFDVENLSNGNRFYQFSKEGTDMDIHRVNSMKKI